MLRSNETPENPLYFFALMIIFMVVNLFMLVVMPLPETSGKPLLEHETETLEAEPYYQACLIRKKDDE